MRNWILIIFLTLFQILAFGQNLNGIYTWKGELKGPKSDSGILEIKITNDSTFTQTDFTGYKKDFNGKANKWKKIIRTGKIRKDGGFYTLTLIGNQKNWNLVKIRKNKLITYGYKLKKNGKLRKVKGIELIKASR